MHIYWDGSLGICCQEAHRLYSTAETQYNIATMSIAEWFNSDPVRDFRKKLLADKQASECSRCYIEERHNGQSRRIRANQKSVIFTQAFDESFEQSPGRKYFVESGLTTTQPIDLHVDLGNYCNLACKMCNAQASSTIASQLVKWGQIENKQYLGLDWTQDNKVWNKFCKELVSIPNLNNIHFMGGETLLTDRLDELVDYLIDNNRLDVCLSFVTNGTVFKPELIKKLSQFRRVGIEISIEAVDEHNAYQRQGTDTKLVLSNIKQYQELCNGTSVTVTLRPAPSLLTIGYLPGLLKYAIDNKLIIKSNLCYDPDFLFSGILPRNVKQLYLGQYQDIIAELNSTAIATDYNASNPVNYLLVAKEQLQMYVSLLESPTPDNSDELLEKMVKHCSKWDKAYQLDARQLYPEFKEIFDKYGY
jgi:pyruvate-formate lyase-activating enzyme